MDKIKEVSVDGEVVLKNCKSYNIGNRRFIKCDLGGSGQIKKEDIIKIANQNE